MRLRPFVLLLAVGLSLAAAETPPGETPPPPAVPAAKILTLADVGVWVDKVAKATTSAQVFAFQKKALAQLEGATIKATYVVTDVKAVTLNQREMYSIEGANAEPAFVIRFYTDDEDGALAINAGDTVTMTGTGHGIYFKKGASLAVDQAKIVEVKPAAPATPEAPPAP